MNQGKRLIIRYGLVVVAILLVLLLLWNLSGKQPAKKNAINEISQPAVESQPVKSQVADTSQPAVKINDLTAKQTGSDINRESNESLGFMDIYRQLQTARACGLFYMRWEQHGLEWDLKQMVRPPVYVYGQPEYSVIEPVPISAGQSDMLTHWATACYQLWQDYGEFADNKQSSIPINDMVEAVSSQLMATSAKTAKEQRLKRTMQLTALWQDSLERLKQALEGEDSMADPEVQGLYQQLETLQIQREEAKQVWFAARTNEVPNEDSLRDQYFDLLNQTRDLEQRIKSQKEVNPDLLKQAELNFQNVDHAMIQGLQTRDAEVFFEIMYAFQDKPSHLFFLLGYRHGSYDPVNSYLVTPDQLVYQASGYVDPVLHAWELRYASHLYLCELGWDCGPQSPIMGNFCLTGILNSYPDACSTDLPQFYRESLISPNRWQDVMMFKSIYKELFYE